MEMTELINTDTVKLTLIPGIIVVLVLFFWFRRSTPKVTLKQREAARARGEGDPLFEGADPDGWRDGVRVLSRGEPLAANAAEAPSAVTESFAADSEPRAMNRNVTPLRQPRSEDPVSVPVAEPIRTVQPTEPAAVAEVPRAAEPAAVELRTSSTERTDSAASSARESDQGLMLVLNVMAPAGRQLRGPAVLKAVSASGLTFGKMNIFHYYAPSRPANRPLFSLANMMEPGSFNLATLDELSTPGLTLFASVARPEEAAITFSAMLDVARKLADYLHATVCDERRGTLSKQGIEHIHARIQDFQRRSRLAQAAHG